MELQKISTTEKMKQNPDFQKGVELFRKFHNLEPVYLEARKLIDESGEVLQENNTVYFRWYKKLLPKKQVPENAEILSEEGVGVNKKCWVAFRAVVPPEGCLEIRSPFFEKAEKPPQETKVADLFS